MSTSPLHFRIETLSKFRTHSPLTLMDNIYCSKRYKLSKNNYKCGFFLNFYYNIYYI